MVSMVRAKRFGDLRGWVMTAVATVALTLSSAASAGTTGVGGVDGAMAKAAGTVFANGFDDSYAGVGPRLPEGAVGVMLVPRFFDGTIVVYRRLPAGVEASPLRTVSVAGAPYLNALAITADHKVWATDVAGSRLLRLDLEQLVNNNSVTPEVVIGPLAGTPDPVGVAIYGSDLFVAVQNYFSGNTISQVLRFPLASIASTGNPAPAQTYTSGLSAPAGIAFDPFGRLWISNYGDNSVTVLNRDDGTQSMRLTNTAVGSRNAFNRPEGIAFDHTGGVWVANNGEPTLTALGHYRANNAATGTRAATVVKSYDYAPGNNALTDTYGGLAFDDRVVSGENFLYAHYQKSEQIHFLSVTATGTFNTGLGTVIGGYDVSNLFQFPNSARYPGFGGIAFYPVPRTVHR